MKRHRLNNLRTFQSWDLPLTAYMYIEEGNVDPAAGQYDANLIIHAFFQSILVWAKPRVSGRELLLQARRQLIQAYCKLSHVVPA